jgi:hypothetical protein
MGNYDNMTYEEREYFFNLYLIEKGCWISDSRKALEQLKIDIKNDSLFKNIEKAIHKILWFVSEFGRSKKGDK